MDDANWTSVLDHAKPVLSLPAQCGQTAPCFIRSLGVYAMVTWYNTATLKKWYQPNEMRYDFYQAAHPWGPWTFINALSDSFIVGGHMYGPSFCARFQEIRGGETRIAMFTSGCPFEDKPAGLYKLWMIPLVLRTNAVPAKSMVNDSDARIRYVGNWTSSQKRPYRDYMGDIHHATNVNDSAELKFTGTGIEYIAEKHSDHGVVDVFIDDQFQQEVHLSLTNMPRLSQVVVFRKDGLPEREHTIKIVNKSEAYAVVDAFRVLTRSEK
jgi:hypothetical protein